VLILSKLMIVLSVVGLLRCSSTFRERSSEFDEQVFAALKRLMRTTEECGYPPQLIPALIVLTVICFMLSMALTAGAR
jgi:hypothetical protein